MHANVQSYKTNRPNYNLNTALIAWWFNSYQDTNIILITRSGPYDSATGGHYTIHAIHYQLD